MVDGEYCAVTKAPVKGFQATHPPLKVDGWALHEIAGGGTPLVGPVFAADCT